MSKPFIIWTFQRTGGTTLTALLKNFSEQSRTLFEPMKRDKAFNDLVVDYIQTLNAEALQPALRAEMKDLPNLKNTYELPHWRVKGDRKTEVLHQALFDVSEELGYKHVILDRKSDTSRVLSRELARQTGAWGKRQANKIYPAYINGEKKVEPLSVPMAIGLLHHCMDRRRWLIRTMESANVKPKVVMFEDVYGTGEEGEKRVDELFDFLEIKKRPGRYYRKMRDEALHRKSQKSVNILSMVPNLEEVRAALDTDEQARNPWLDYIERHG